MAVHLMNSFTADEIARTSKARWGWNSHVATPEVIFRGNSVASRALGKKNSISLTFLDYYMKFIGSEYLKSTLQPVLSKLFAYKKSLEVDPIRIEKASQLEHNIKKIEQFTQEVLTVIFNSIDNCPPYEQYEMRSEIVGRWENAFIICKRPWRRNLRKNKSKWRSTLASVVIFSFDFSVPRKKKQFLKSHVHFLFETTKSSRKENGHDFSKTANHS